MVEMKKVLKTVMGLIFLTGLAAGCVVTARIVSDWILAAMSPWVF
jgi:hypothetical protein